MQEKNLPETYKGYTTKELLKTWDELMTKEGTKASGDQMKIMDQFLKEYKLGLFGIKSD